MELRQLTTFCVVAADLSFTRAAEALNYAQSSVTAQILSLEEELGTKLFERLGKRVSLTDAGRRLLPYAERLLRLAEEARDAAQGDEEPSGTLHIGSPESLCVYRLMPVLSQFRSRFPQVHVTFRPGFCADLRRELQEGRLDICFLLEPPLHTVGLIIEPLVPESLLLLTFPGHPLTTLDRVDPARLAGEPLLLTEVGCSYRVPFERTLAQAGARPGAVLEFGSIEAIKHCVMAGMGITFLPAITVTSELAQGRLVALPWTGGDYGLITQMAVHKDKWLSPALRAFLDLSRSVLGTAHEQIAAAG